MLYFCSRGSAATWRQAADATDTLAPRPRWSTRTRNVRGRTYLSYGGSGTTSIQCEIGTATAAGLSATIGLATAVQAGIGSAAASGLQATIGAGTSISFAVGTAAASGLAASIFVPTVIACAVAEAFGSGLAVTITIGSATVHASRASRKTQQLSGSGRPAQLGGTRRPRQLS